MKVVNRGREVLYLFPLKESRVQIFWDTVDETEQSLNWRQKGQTERGLIELKSSDD